MIRGEKCRNCEDTAVIPVLDKNIERSPRPGNKYRRCCLTCGKWHKMTSQEYFERHSHPYILPLGESEHTGLVKRREYDYGPEIDDLVDHVTQNDPEPEAEVATDGGTEVADLGENDETEDSENTFICPSEGCEAEHTGYPDQCGECGTDYHWGTVENE